MYEQLAADQVCEFLLDRSLVIAEERQYTLSLELEPRAARGSSGGLPSAPSPAS
jgi:hypothetical protein